MVRVGRPPVEVDELVEHWTVLEDEQQLVAGKRGATRLGFALMLKFYTAVRPLSPGPLGAAAGGSGLRGPSDEGGGR